MPYAVQLNSTRLVITLSVLLFGIIPQQSDFKEFYFSPQTSSKLNIKVNRDLPSTEEMLLPSSPVSATKVGEYLEV